MSSNNAPGIDKIRMKDIKYCGSGIIKTIVDFINYSICEGVIPEGLKVAMVRPIFKQGGQNVFKNYRPISILPTLEKILERYVSKHLNEYLSSHSLLNAQQYGFQIGKSTTSLLINFSELVNNKLNCNKIVLALFIDFSK